MKMTAAASTLELHNALEIREKVPPLKNLHSTFFVLILITVYSVN